MQYLLYVLFVQYLLHVDLCNMCYMWICTFVQYVEFVLYVDLYDCAIVSKTNVQLLSIFMSGDVISIIQELFTFDLSLNAK